MGFIAQIFAVLDNPEPPSKLQVSTSNINPMASSALRKPSFLIGVLNLTAISASTYHLRSHLVYNLEEQEARLDEIEGTLRGHIGLIEESLDRIEGKGGEAGKKT